MLGVDYSVCCTVQALYLVGALKGFMVLYLVQLYDTFNFWYLYRCDPVYVVDDGVLLSA
jgi:hypothetical protein